MVQHPLKIVRFEARNTKRLKAVVIEPDPAEPIVKLTGRNRQGKTSVIDAIWFALGGQSAIPTKPIREGEAEAFTSVDLGDFIVERNFTEKGSYLNVKTKDGFKAPSPQTFLTSKLGSRARNPLQFMRLTPAEQVKALQGMVQISLDPVKLGSISGLSTKGITKADDPIAVLDSTIKHLFEKRTAINQEVKRLEGVVKTTREEIPAGMESTEPVSIKELFEARAALDKIAKENNDKRVKVEQVRRKLGDLSERKRHLLERIMDIEAQLRQLRDSQSDLDAMYDRCAKALVDAEAEVADLVDPDFTEIDARIAEADETNRIANLVNSLAAHTASLLDEKTKAEDLTSRIEAVREYKTQLIEQAGLPVAGLGFEGGEVTYNGIPLSQASTREQIGISCEICMSTHPEIGILTLDQGWNELDRDGKEILRFWAEKVGAQIWVTSVTDDPNSDGFFIEDGEVVAVNGELLERRECGANDIASTHRQEIVA